MTGLQECLNELWSATIESHAFDLLRGVVTLQLRVYRAGGLWTARQLEFAHVSAFYYTNGEGKKRFEMWEEGDHLELTSITYYERGVGPVSAPASVEGRRASWHPNFAMEIWFGWLLIEARSVRIDDAVFDIPVPAGGAG